MKKTIIIKTGDTLPDIINACGDFEEMIASGLRISRDKLRVVNVTAHEALPDMDQINGVVISGSHAMVTQELDWSLALEAWIRKWIAAEIPLLGICFGHQLMAKAMGGVVDYHPRGIEIGTTDVICLDECAKDPLFKDLPPSFKAHVIHSQSVIQLPPSAVLLAKNDFEPHHGFRLGAAAWGVQFHPEADVAMTRGYIENLVENVRSSGQDPDQLIGLLEETPHATLLLKTFGEIVTSREKGQSVKKN